MLSHSKDIYPKWVLQDEKSARVKNYKEVLVEKEGGFYFGTHALLAIKIHFVIYTLPPPRNRKDIVPLASIKKKSSHNRERIGFM